MRFAPPWAIIGGAVHSDEIPETGPTVTNPHLARGVHVRVLPSKLLGLPATPLFVSRCDIIGDSISGFARRTDIRWIDSNGQDKGKSFDVEGGNTVTGWLPGPKVGTCIWIDVAVDIIPVIGFEGGELAAAAAAVNDPPFVVEARISSAQGSALLGSRTTSPFTFGASAIEQIVIKQQPSASFSTRVLGVFWMALEDIPLRFFVPWRVWSLPVGSTPRYRATPTAAAEADARVSAGAPPHRPLHILPVDGGPSASPAATPAEETARIARLRQGIQPMLNQLVNDLSAPPSQLALPSYDFTDPNLDGHASIPSLGQVLQSSVDPGMARWMGFSEVDAAPPGTDAGDVVFYMIRGLWAQDPTRPALEQIPLALLSPALVRPGPALGASFPELASIGGPPTGASRFYDLAIIVAANLGFPPDPPAPPVSEGVEDDGWRPDLLVPEARRLLTFPMSGIVPAAAIAFADEDSGPPPQSRTLNPRLGPITVVRPGEAGYATALPIALAATVEDGAPQGTGVFHDRDCGELGGSYRMGQADWFGRWSEWDRIPVGPRPRTPPPQPTLELHYQVPTLDPADLLPDPGIFTIAVPVPRREDLPPGGRLLVDLALDMIVDGVQAIGFTFPLPPQAGTIGAVTLDPAPSTAGPGLLKIQFTGPALRPAASATVTFVGTWGDGTQRSTPGSATKRIVDPRPVPPPVLPTDLIYARRPDARGNARLELPLPAASPLVRIYYTTETTALRGLELLAAGGSADAVTARDEITAAAQGSARAQAFGRWKRLFDYSMFENLTTAPFQAPSSGGVYPHALSASLQGLALYRVLSVSPSGVLSDFATSPMVAAMVPNFGAPARPLLDTELVPAGQGGGVRLNVKVPAGTLAPIAFRVRRATQPYSDARQMQPVNAGDLTAVGSPPGSWLQQAPTTDDQGMSFTLLDPGPLDAWRRYFWCVEVQASPPPGAPTSGSFIPAGEWSVPSAAAIMNIIPPDPPGPPTSVTAQRVGPDVQVTITATGAAAVVGTRFGTFSVELFRSTAAGARPKTVSAPVVQTSPTEFTVTDPGAPDGAIYSARIVDPFGRRGTPTSTSTPV